jgi:hypothetical protein
MIQTKIKITATPNYSKRTFTIRCYADNVIYAKYRTTVMDQEEFDGEEWNTQNDWEQFLRYGDYSVIK